MQFCDLPCNRVKPSASDQDVYDVAQAIGSLQVWVQIGNYGFPMVIAFYLLVRVEKKLDDLTVAINELARTLGKNALDYR